MNKMSRTCCGLLFLLAGCNTLPVVPTFLNASQLPSQLLEINTERDTTVTLNDGTILTIPANALHIDGSKIAKLEVKEALTPEQILAAGLRTQSNGEPLSSGGMIYINTADNSKLSFNQPVKVKIPARKIVDGMQLYKGEVKASGIDWKDPKPLPVQEQEKEKEKKKIDGKALFEQNCTSCHSVTRQITGPALANVMERWKYDTTTLYAFMSNSSQVIASGHCYAANLFYAFNKQVMPNFISFTKDDMDALFAYIDDESQKHPEYKDSNQHAFDPDSCAYYKTVVQLAADLTGAREGQEFTVVNSFSQTGISLPSVVSGDEIIFTPLQPAPDQVIPERKTGVYYNFTINAPGWYNVDVLTKDLPGFSPCYLSVTVNEMKDQNVAVFLLIPAEKVVLQGGLQKDGKAYGFYKNDGEISLPLGAEAVVVSFAENTGKAQLYFGSKRFIIEEKQIIDIEIQPSDEKTIHEEIKRLRLPDLTLKINKLQLTAEQKRIAREADRVRDQVVLCNCTTATDSTAVRK